MDVNHIDQALACGAIDRPGVFPQLDALAEGAFVFPVDFLSEEP